NADAEHQRATPPVPTDHEAERGDEDQADQQDRPLRAQHRAGGLCGVHRAFSASSTTLANRKASVSSPTPPGFGDTCPATSHTSGATSPTSLPLSSRLTPTSTTAAPGFTISAVTMCGTPAA